jgi:hypothetical protein
VLTHYRHVGQGGVWPAPPDTDRVIGLEARLIKTRKRHPCTGGLKMSGGQVPGEIDRGWAEREWRAARKRERERDITSCLSCDVSQKNICLGSDAQHRLSPSHGEREGDTLTHAPYRVSPLLVL